MEEAGRMARIVGTDRGTGKGGGLFSRLRVSTDRYTVMVTVVIATTLKRLDHWMKVTSRRPKASGSKTKSWGQGSLTSCP